jgi:hypothetical protein
VTSEEAQPAVATAPTAVPQPDQQARIADACENCGTPVTGKYCSECGQRHTHSVHSVWHFAHEATEDLTHADSRLWQTLLALLAKPGALTREYLDGRRVRYLPPLRLYLVLSVAYFLIAAVMPPKAAVVQITTSSGQSSSTNKGLNVHFQDTAPVQVSAFQIAPGHIDETCQEMTQKSRPVWSRFGLLEKHVTTSCHKVLSDGGTAYRAAFMENLPRAMFVFLPVLALFPLLLYWNPRHYYVEHLLFFVHNHAFMFLVFGLDRLATAALPSVISSLVDLAATAYVPFYLFRAMRRVYGQGRALTLAKFVALVCVYAVTGVAVLLGTGLYSALTL